LHRNNNSNQRQHTHNMNRSILAHEQHLQPQQQQQYQHRQQYQQQFHLYYHQHHHHHHHQNNSNSNSNSKRLLLYYKSEKVKLERAALLLEQKRDYYTNGMKNTKQDIQQKSEVILSLEEQISQQQDSNNINLQRKWKLEIDVQQLEQHYDSFRDYIEDDLPEEEIRIQVEINRVYQEIQRLKDERKYRHHYYHHQQQQLQQGLDHNRWRRSITTDHRTITTTVAATLDDAAAPMDFISAAAISTVQHATALIAAAPTPHIRQHCNRDNRHQYPNTTTTSTRNPHQRNRDDRRQEPNPSTTRHRSTIAAEILLSSTLPVSDTSSSSSSATAKRTTSSTSATARNSKKNRLSGNTPLSNNIKINGSKRRPPPSVEVSTTATKNTVTKAVAANSSRIPHLPHRDSDKQLLSSSRIKPGTTPAPSSSATAMATNQKASNKSHVSLYLIKADRNKIYTVLQFNILFSFSSYLALFFATDGNNRTSFIKITVGRECANAVEKGKGYCNKNSS
jgi:hypothetical protein